MNSFIKENHDKLYKELLPSEELINCKILDLGCQYGWLGNYCINNGASEYIGIDINKKHIDQASLSFPNLSFFNIDLENYVTDCVTKQQRFDIVVITRTLQGIQNQVTLLQQISKITDNILIETGVPINNAVYKIFEILKDVELSNNIKEKLKKIQSYVEYEHVFVEYIIDDRWPQPMPSIALIKDVLERLGYELNLGTYEFLKVQYPDEYGYGLKNCDNNFLKRTVIKGKKINISKPLSWKEYYEHYKGV